eukprot:jgi/Ulvmu1/3240/UM150_0013.1
MAGAALSTLFLLAASAQAALGAPTNQDHDSDTVHIVFSNHLDIGFGGIWPELGFDDNVINMYFDWYIPTAIRMGQYFEETSGTESHVYTMHSYIASLYMSCPPGMGLHCPTASQQKEFCQAVTDGHISWTAFPHNAQMELMDEETILGALQMTHDLDHMCGVPVKTVISQRDVPGMTRAVLPVITELWWGPVVRAVSVGVNSASAPPDVPLNTPFVWREEATDSQLIAFWHAGGYGGETVYKGHTLPLTPAGDCVRTPARASGSRDILCFSWRADNKGPFEDPKDVMLIFEAARAAFPGATVKASTFEKFVDKLAPHADALPVVTGEIGDTWIHGVASDPVKMKEYRAMMRMRSQCLYDGGCVIQDPAFQNFTRLFLKVPEHTWGIDTKSAPASWGVWGNDDFRAALKDNPKFAQAEQSWSRQRQYISWSLQALDRDPFVAKGISAADAATKRPRRLSPGTRTFAAQAAATMERLRTSHADAVARIHPAHLPDLLGCSPASRQGGSGGTSGLEQLPGHVLDSLRCGGEDEVVLDADGWYIAVNSSTGAITQLRRTWPADDGKDHPGTDWAAGGVFGQLQYSTYSEQYFKDWGAGYNPVGAGWYDVPWMRYDYGKPGAGDAAQDRSVAPEVMSVNLYTGEYQDQVGVAIKYRFAGWPVDEAGAPPVVTLLVHTWAGSDAVMMDVLYDQKLPTRLPEALWLRFAPPASAADPSTMLISKVNSWISPTEIVRNGSFNLHGAMDGGVSLRSAQHAWEQLQVGAMDTALVAVGAPEVLPDIRGPARPEDGLAFNLFNNAWGTNYVMWTPYAGGTGADIKSRFVVTVRDTRNGPQATPLLLRDPLLASVPRHLLI